MQDVFTAITRAARDLFDPRIIAIVFLPMLGSVLLWTVLAWLFWSSWTGGIAAAMASTTVAGWLQGWSAMWVIDYTAAFLVLVGLLPAIYVTALLITETFAMPVIVRFVSERDHPQLARAAGGTLAGSLINAAGGIAVFALLWIFTLPLWLTGVGAVLAPLLTSAWLAQRLFRYDALAEHARGRRDSRRRGGCRDISRRSARRSSVSRLNRSPRRRASACAGTPRTPPPGDRRAPRP